MNSTTVRERFAKGAWKTFVPVVCFLLFARLIFAQSAEEALRYSTLRFGGTARGLAAGGAFGAIGADYTSVISNPAGLALFRKPELMFTMQLEHIKTDSRYENYFTSDDRFNFNIGNFGAAVPIRRKKEDKFKSINFGFGYNRLANFYSDRYYHSGKTDNSVLQSYANELNGVPHDEISYGSQSFESVLAYDAYLVNPIPGNNPQYSTVTDNIKVNQQISFESRGALDEMSLSVAANYDHKIYFGGYLGIPLLFYKERVLHSEASNSSDSESFNYFELDQRLNTFAAGVNFKVGVIARASDWVRLGVAYHTPTFYGMHDDFDSHIYSDFDTVNYPVSSPYGEFDYNLVTPGRLVASVGAILKKYAFLSFDYEWVNYGAAHYKMENYYTLTESDLNYDITRLYGSAHVFRAGAEVAIEKFRLRGGYAHYGSPYENTGIVGDYDAATSYYTGGIGIRLKKVYFDFAYARSHTKAVHLTVNDELLYDDSANDRFMLTTGFRF